MWQKIKNFYHLLTSYVASVYYGFPSKKLIVVGVTGTDGKTTTVNMIYHILKTDSTRVSMLSSVNAQIGTKAYDTGFHVTTPSPWSIQRYLAKAVNSNSKYFVMETTSHGLDQNRVANVKFKVGVITNITDEHLDYHKTWENYAQAKVKLLTMSENSVVNLDDKSYGFLKDRIKNKIVTYSLEREADFTPDKFKLKLKLPGDYNLANAQAAAAATSILGIKKSKIQKALSKFSGVKGRMEDVNEGQSFKVIVDFAHTPNSLKQALTTLRNMQANGRLIAVFGSAGLRDKTKRPAMGEIAASLADVSILTAEDPRTEKVSKIITEIAQGFKKLRKIESKDYFIVEDRAQAITFAINLAKKGDVVACFGKSHEKSMCYGKKEYPWDEFQTVKSAIKAKKKGKND